MGVCTVLAVSVITISMLLSCAQVHCGEVQKEKSMVWYSPKEPPIQVSGLAWFDSEKVYRRLPVNPVYPLPEAVNNLANHTAGGQIRFRTDSGSVSVRVKLTGPAYMSHMTGAGQCGVDCYVGPVGRMRFVGTAKPELGHDEYEGELFSGASREMRDITLNLPLYQGVKEIEVGLDEGAAVEAPLPYESDRRIIVYGTSIQQGGCATRPGMAHTNIVSRHINREFINLGFSGNGKGEPDVARDIALIERPGLYILDYEANVTPDQLEETLPEFITILRQAHPDVPILVVSKTPYAKETLLPSVREPRLRNLKFMRATVEKLRKAGDRSIHFLDSSNILGDDFDDCTVDGVHPTDLGFYRMAAGLEKAIRPLLAKRK